MKCSARLIYYKKSTKLNKKRLFTSLASDWDLDGWLGHLPKKTLEKINIENIEICGGKIVSQIGCHSEFTEYENDSYAQLDVNFVCKKCGQYHHPDLPSGEYDLNEWLTKIVEEM